MILRTSIFKITSLILLSIISSCGTNCRDFDCVNGECNKGVCECDEGYEGQRCNASWADQIAGIYKGKDCYDSDNVSYTIARRGSSPDSININSTIKAVILDTNTFYIPNQEFEQDNLTLTIEGEGKVFGKSLNLKILYQYENFPSRCEFNLKRETN